MTISFVLKLIVCEVKINCFNRSILCRFALNYGINHVENVSIYKNCVHFLVRWNSILPKLRPHYRTCSNLENIEFCLLFYECNILYYILMVCVQYIKKNRQSVNSTLKDISPYDKCLHCLRHIHS